MPKALVVDDNNENLYLLQTLLSASGFEVTTATNGREALSCADNDPPDLVISDILMPVMDGFSLCREWKKDELRRSTPFIFYTATYTEPEDEQFALTLGADLFLVKPKDPEVLVRILLEVLEKNKKGEIIASPASPPGEEEYFQLYNRTLIRKLEKKIFQLEEANRALAVKDFAIASSISGIVFTDSAGTLTYANESFAVMWGYPSGDLPGMNVNDLLTDKEKASRFLAVLNTEGQWIGEIEAVKQNGRTFTVQIAAHAVKGKDGKTICLMASCVDISEQMRMREELEHAQKLESVSLFAAGIAHDFNNLLTSMSNGLTLMKGLLPLQSPVKSHFDMTVSIFNKAMNLTRRLHTFAKGESPLRKKIMVAEIVRESCTLSLGGSRVRYTVTVDDNPWFVEADAVQLSQVFNNIILNARQAMEDQGLLEVSIDNRVLSANSVGTLPAGNYVGISFRDTGPGIPEKTIQHIFGPFFTTKREGLGLGLVTSSAIIKSHGGHISASSRVGAGATFIVWLPALFTGEWESGRAPSLEMTPVSGRILVMDGEEIIRSLAMHILTKAGYNVSTAGGGREAVEIYRGAIHGRRPFDLVILNLSARDGMGGEQTLAELRKINPRVGAIASSRYSGNTTLSRAKEIGFLGLLLKPFQPYELLSAVKAAIANRKTSNT